MPTPLEAELVTCIPALQRYAHKLTDGQAAAEDLVQDCLERALRNTDKFQPGTNLEAWLMTILKNLFFTERRRSRRCPQVALEDQNVVVPPPQVARIALDEAADALRALPPAQRALVTLVAIDGLSYGDVAQRLGVPVGTVRSRLSRVREQIRHGVEDRGHRPRAAAPRPVPGPRRGEAERPDATCAAPSSQPAPPPTARRQRPSALPASVARLRRRTLPEDARIPPAPAVSAGRPQEGLEPAGCRGPPPRHTIFVFRTAASA